MIRDYKKIQCLQKLSPNSSLYHVQNNGSSYFMHEFTQINECDQFSFKVIKKLVTSPNVTKIYNKFIENDKTYFITQYFSSNLLQQQLKQPNQIFQVSTALQIFSKIVQLIEELHQNKLIYRNLRLQMISFKDKQLYLSDFTLTQIVKRKERYFQVVGVTNYLAPEFYMEDGYGFQVDIWSAGICLYFMLTGSFPFDCADKSNEEIIHEINSKCKKGFDFQKTATCTQKQKIINYNKNLQDLLKKIFVINYTERITLDQLKKHSTLKKYFYIENSFEHPSSLSIIEEQKTSLNSSIFVSQLKNFPSHFQFHKEEIIFDFLERSSEVLMLESPQIITEEIRFLVNFSILKVAVLKANNLTEIFLGKKQPQFKINADEWNEMTKAVGFQRVKKKIEKKKKILQMLFKGACMNIKGLRQPSNFYSDEIPSDFAAIKHEYRLNLGVMFEIEKQIIKKKQSNENIRRTCQNLARLTILCMINRIFKQTEVKENFQFYFKWSKKQSLEDLQEWIQSERVFNLKAFIINIMNKYMD